MRQWKRTVEARVLTVSSGREVGALPGQWAGQFVVPGHRTSGAAAAANVKGRWDS